MQKFIHINSFGKSMFPLISSGDLLSIRTDYSLMDIRTGDIVLYKNYAGDLYAHRVLQILDNSERLLRVKGDFNESFDTDLVSEKNYLGLVIKIENDLYVSNSKQIYSTWSKFLFSTYSLSMHFNLTRRILFKIVHNYSFFELFILKQIFTKKNLSFTFKAGEYLLNIIKNQTECSWDFKTDPIEFNDLKKIAESNKLSNYLEHLINCKYCKKYFKQEDIKVVENYIKSNIFLDFQKKNIIDDLVKFATNIDTEIIFLKKTKEKYNIKDTTTYDIDILIKKRNIKKLLKILFVAGYRIVDCPPQEIHLRHKIHKLVLDLHYYSSIPRTLLFSKKSTVQLTKDLIQHSTQGILDKEYYLFSSTVRLWANDFFHGLRKIYEQSKIMSDDKKIDWIKLKNISEQYKFWKEVQLLMYVGNRLFNIDLNEDYLLLNGTDKKIRLISKFFSLERVSQYYGEDNWWDENSFFTRKLLVELHVIRIILNEPFYKIIFKPRVLFFLFRCIKL